MSILASRDQYCLHPTISTYHSVSQSSACRSAVSSSSCLHYANYKKFAKPPVDTVRDIEDFVAGCAAHKTCPYYSAQFLAQSAEVVLLPYNYLTDRNLQHRHKSLINDSIIVFDEAHNITKFCENGYTFALPASVMNAALDALEGTPALKKCQEICEFLEEFYENDYQSSFFQFFESFVTFDDVKQLRHGETNYNQGLNELIDFLGNILDIVDSNTTDSYNILFESETQSLVCVCLDPSISLKTLHKFNARSLLITSGTISPLPTLIKELDTEFSEVLRNDHVIKPSQSLVQVSYFVSPPCSNRHEIGAEELWPNDVDAFLILIPQLTHF